VRSRNDLRHRDGDRPSGGDIARSPLIAGSAAERALQVDVNAQRNRYIPRPPCQGCRLQVVKVVDQPIQRRSRHPGHVLHASQHRRRTGEPPAPPTPRCAARANPGAILPRGLEPTPSPTCVLPPPVGASMNDRVCRWVLAGGETQRLIRATAKGARGPDGCCRGPVRHRGCGTSRHRSPPRFVRGLKASCAAGVRARLCHQAQDLAGSRSVSRSSEAVPGRSATSSSRPCCWAGLTPGQRPVLRDRVPLALSKG